MRIRPLGYRYIFAYARNAVFFAVPALLVMSFFLLSPIISNGTHATDDANNTNTANEDPSISIIPTGDLIIPINNCTGIGDGSNNTTVCTGTMDTSISITTSVTGGYSLYMNTSTTDNALSALGTSTSTISSITNPHSSLSSFPNNTWGYSKDNGATYLPIPTSTATAEQRQIATTASAGTSTHNIDFAAKTGLSNTAGRYENTIIFSAVTNPTIFYLNYDANGGTGAPAQATCTSFESTCSFIVSDIIPTKDNYNFLGWATSSSATIPEYAAGDIYTATTPTNNTLHAVWEVAARYMQDVADWEDELEIGDQIQAVDQRDGETYYVSRLADGKIWMQDNLRLGGTSTINLTPADTNIASNYTLPASGTPCFTSSSCTGTSGTAGTGYTVAAINTDSKNNTTTSYGSGSGKIGTYYNYCAASAGTYCYASGTSTGDAQYDVCPKGWRMPTGGSSGEYQALYTAYSSNQANFKAALSTPLSGYFGNGSVNDRGSYGLFWSSTYNNGGSMYYLGVGSSDVYPTHYNGRYYGRSVRCVAREIYTLSYDANGGVGAPDAVTQADNNTFTISSTIPTYENDENYVFLGWDTDSSVAEPYYKYNYSTSSFNISTIALDSDNRQETLYAIWGLYYISHYDYTGSEQLFTAPYDGVYKIEVWGAQGGYNDASYPGGLGGYTSGEIELDADSVLYLYVGNMPTTSSGGYNGGGNGNGGYIGGGGATDVRLANGNWNDFDSLKSRIMVAGAGGGGYSYTKKKEYSFAGAAAGGLLGYDAQAYGTDVSKGGTQISGGTVGSNTVSFGGFGYGGNGSGGSSTEKAASGGGGGYYGGGGRYDKPMSYSSGGGGSSFISGHNGCNAVSENSTSGNIIHTGQSNHYSNYVFNNTIMIDGAGYAWSDAKGALVEMPTYDGLSTMIGNAGNGHIKITYINKQG